MTTSEVKHTPGPWRVHGGYGICVVPNEPIGVIGARTIVACRQEWIPGKEQHANARLIAAAPELLEACEGLLGFIRERYPDDFKEGGKGFTCPHHLAIEAAIKKATGQ
jgi:hypothetical protein